MSDLVNLWTMQPVDATLAVPCSTNVTITAAWPARHLCPHVPEIDRGSVEITWTTAGATLELHALRAWLGEFDVQRISHEDMTAVIRDRLSALSGITDVEVLTCWQTAGAEVVVHGAVPGQPHLAEGA